MRNRGTPTPEWAEVPRRSERWLWDARESHTLARGDRRAFHG